MINDFSKHQHIIDEFRGKVSAADFESNFATKTTRIQKTERFLLKMEIKRLADECTRLVDLRGLVDGECKLFEHDNRSHYLDDIAIDVYQENLALYGKYTLGVYEAVTNTENNFRVIYHKEKSGLKNKVIKKINVEKVPDKHQFPAQLVKFGQYHNRFEERMNFSVAMLVNYKNDHEYNNEDSQEGKNEDKHIECNSSDISVNGCKFRVSSKEKLVLEQVISIRFLGLEKEFAFGSKGFYEYKIKNIQLSGKFQLVGVSRVYKENLLKDVFKDFLTGFIKGNKRRYKINLDNSITALQARNYEQYVLPKSNELPIFLSGNNDDIIPEYALTCLNNHRVFEYWQDERRYSTLHYLLTPERINKLKKLHALGKSLLVYSFINVHQGKYFFYTVDEFQLKDDIEFLSECLGFAANKPYFAVTSLSLNDFDVSKADSFYTLSESIKKRDQYLNLPTSESDVNRINELTYLVVINDITHEKITHFYQLLSFSNIDATRLKAFRHERVVTPMTVENIGINYKNHRQESRFKFKTPIELKSGELSVSAESQDFSTSGLKLEFKQPVSLNKGDLVYLSFPVLQKITSAFDLKSLPYSIVRINEKNTILNLKVKIDRHKHTGKRFFKALIEKNKHKLTPDEYALLVEGLVKPLRNIYTSSVNIPSVVIQNSGSRYKAEVITCGQENTSLMALMRQLSTQANQYNLSPILGNQPLMDVFMASLKKMHANDAPITDMLYIAVNLDAENIDERVITKSFAELNTLKQQRLFVKSALKTGSFLCVQLKLSRTNPPDMDYLNPELGYISSYAIHRGKQIEQDIWSVSGVIQMLDITKETMIRLKLAL